MDERMPIHPGDEMDYKLGNLPGHKAPLAIPFVPFQSNNPPQYNSIEGFNRGTIFPGLDLPWANTVNKTNPAENTLLGDLSALDFAAFDLQLFLDTHPNDKDALDIRNYYLGQIEACRKEYVRAHGPLTIADAEQDGHHNWLNDPWPWEYMERKD